MASLFNCWNCDKYLVGAKRPAEHKLFFYCNDECHDTHESKMNKISQTYKQWSDFMCGEAECPEDLVDHAIKKGLLEKNPEKNLMSSGRRSRRSPKKTSEKLTEYSKKLTDASRKNTGSKVAKRVRELGQSSRTVTCGRCGTVGHNARTCKKDK